LAGVSVYGRAISTREEKVDKGRRSRWWRREGRSHKSFKYTDADGKQIRRQSDIDRVNALAIPPAWKDVRICPSPGGRLQAVGVDDAGRIQYIYHSSFTEKQGRKKFAKIEKFGDHLGKLREKTNRDIRLKGFPREKVLAIMIRLVNELYIRVGGEESAKTFKTHGITTLKNEHLKIGQNGELNFDFVGKSYIRHKKVLADKKLASLMAELRRLGTSKKLFHYLTEEGETRAVKPAELNQYLKDATSDEFSLKDLRTWGASLLAAVKLAEIGPAETEAKAKKNIVSVIKEVAEELGNTVAVCRASYIHPAILKAYSKGITLSNSCPKLRRDVRKIARLEPEEKALIRFFKQQNGE